MGGFTKKTRTIQEKVPKRGSPQKKRFFWKEGGKEECYWNRKELGIVRKGGGGKRGISPEETEGQTP